MNSKRLIAFLVCCLMVFASISTAFAATLSFDLTVNDVTGVTKIKLYRIVEIEESTVTPGALMYTLSDKYESVFDTAGIDKAADLETADVKDLLDACKTNIGAATAADKEISLSGSESSAKAEDIEMGYYYILMEGAEGTVYNPLLTMVPTLSDEEPPAYSDTVVSAKSHAPVPVKQVKEGDAWGDKANADIGDVVEYKVTVDVPKYAENVADSDVVFKLTDTMSAGLTWIEGQTVSVTNAGGQEITGALKAGSPSAAAAGTDTVVSFDFDYAKIKNETTITVAYKAVLNDEAAVGAGGNANGVTLTYTNDPQVDIDSTYTTPEDETFVYTYGLEVLKAELGHRDIVLAGAHFTLSKDKADYYFIDNTGGNYTALSPEVYDFAAAADGSYTATPKAGFAGLETLTGVVREVISAADGSLTIDGLDEGDYLLTETQAPDDYYIMTENIEFTITASQTGGSLDGNVSTGGSTGNEAQTADAYYHKTVYNSTKYVLPETGDRGIVLLIGCGALLSGIACLLLWKRRRQA